MPTLSALIAWAVCIGAAVAFAWGVFRTCAMPRIHQRPVCHALDLNRVATLANAGILDLLPPESRGSQTSFSLPANTQR